MALCIFFALLNSPALADEIVDLELVLAIDASSSVDDDEWELQRQGYAAAFRDPEIQAAITSGPKKRIAIAVVVWADATVPRWDSDWFVLAKPMDSERLAGFMAALPRIPVGGTGIGAGLAFAIRKLDRNGLTAPRQVVDVSGDGRETPPREIVVLIPMANALARAKGVIVNGLAIVNEDQGLAAWYRDNVIAGPGSFVMTAAGYEDFSEAIRKKLLKEIEQEERLTQSRDRSTLCNCLMPKIAIYRDALDPNCRKILPIDQNGLTPERLIHVDTLVFRKHFSNS